MRKLFLALTTLITLPLFAQAEDAVPPPSGGLSQMLVFFAIALMFFYFIMWRPEQKRRKAMDTMRNQLKKGDRVNAMGIIGTVAKINDQTIILRMVDGSKIEIIKAAISEVTPCTDEESKKVND